MFKDATLFFSQDNVVTIANVVPTMDRIDAMLNSSATTPLAPGVRHALTFARKLMDKYYSKTDLSNVYRIAMGMYSIFNALSTNKAIVCSAPSSTQTQVLSAARMGEGLDQNSGGDSQG